MFCAHASHSHLLWIDELIYYEFEMDKYSIIITYTIDALSCNTFIGIRKLSTDRKYRSYPYLLLRNILYLWWLSRFNLKNLFDSEDFFRKRVRNGLYWLNMYENNSLFFLLLKTKERGWNFYFLMFIKRKNKNIELKVYWNSNNYSVFTN